jgi:hypothetical protein
MNKVGVISRNSFDLGQATWKTYNLFKKKAVDRSGNRSLLLSLFIAFLIVLIASWSLNLLYKASIGSENNWQNRQESLYQLDRG